MRCILSSCLLRFKLDYILSTIERFLAWQLGCLVASPCAAWTSIRLVDRSSTFNNKSLSLVRSALHYARRSRYPLYASFVSSKPHTSLKPTTQAIRGELRRTRGFEHPSIKRCIFAPEQPRSHSQTISHLHTYTEGSHEHVHSLSKIPLPERTHTNTEIRWGTRNHSACGRAKMLLPKWLFGHLVMREWSAPRPRRAPSMKRRLFCPRRLEGRSPARLPSRRRRRRPCRQCPESSVLRLARRPERPPMPTPGSPGLQRSGWRGSRYSSLPPLGCVRTP